MHCPCCAATAVGARAPPLPHVHYPHTACTLSSLARHRLVTAHIALIAAYSAICTLPMPHAHYHYPDHARITLTTHTPCTGPVAPCVRTVRLALHARAPPSPCEHCLHVLCAPVQRPCSIHTPSLYRPRTIPVLPTQSTPRANCTCVRTMHIAQLGCCGTGRLSRPQHLWLWPHSRPRPTRALSARAATLCCSFRLQGFGGSRTDARCGGSVVTAVITVLLTSTIARLMPQ